ncbi:PilW family protein [Stutzerimonas degradans]|uniref:PilW family protein n=1 Tax=Stutzerimonas degradans TaxID=2968968 RepID=UPI0012D9F570|nr:PilW family protein [Stutzerimonas degradans]MTZ14239.1 prepilin-type N-terminal cleavage/methylation domain-containing protein [Stutzerimonas degradans]NHW02209.1 prepilin-type N-terminal cleavage/methylation domain-containing protein [Stutzerimonas degradans]
MKIAHIASQRGISMIELLVALAISSFLLLGISQIYLDNQRNHLFQQSQSTNLEGSRFITLVLDEYLGKAGYRRDPAQSLESAFPQKGENADCMAFAKGAVIVPTKDALGICLRYQPLVSGEADCQGDASKAFDDSKPFKAAPDSALITVAIKYAPNAELHQGSITCKNLNAAAPGAMEIMSGVADMRLQFGFGSKDMYEKKLTEGSGRFADASSWTANSGPIRAVRYSILLASQENQRSGASTIYDQWIAKSSVAAKSRLTANDKNRIYHVSSSTQTIRNLMP